MDVSYEWFQGLCNSLASNPALATKTLEQFRESDVAVDACMFYLTVPTISHVAVFQAISILQRAAIARWELLPVDKRATIRNDLVVLLNNTVTNQVPAYLVNKLMQSLASIWKRGWLEITNEERDRYFEFIQTLMQNPATSKVATSLLRITLEEFSQQSFAEINMQFAFHVNVKNQFQRSDLIKVFTLAVHPLNILFSWQDAASVAPHLPLMTELFKLLSELIAWNFNEDSLCSKSNADDSALQAHLINKLPKEWNASLVQSNFVTNLFGMYQAICSSPHSFGAEANTLQACALELRNLILCLPTIDGDIFTQAQEKIGYGNHILECSLGLVRSVVVRTETSALAMSDRSADYETGGFRHEQLELFLNIFLRLLGNYKVGALLQMPQYEPTMLVLGSLTVEICKELSTLSQLSMQGYDTWLSSRPATMQGSVGQYPMPVETLLMSTWRGDVLALSLDVWSTILEHPVTLASLQDCNYQSSLGAPAALTAEFATWLRNMSQEIFALGFQSVFTTLVFETLSGAEVEEDEEGALIESRETGDLLTGICTLGRASFLTSAVLLTETLQASVNELHALAQLPVEALNQSAVSQMRCLQALEKCRACVEFSSYLCIDNFHENAELMSKETPIINEHVVYQLQANENGLSVLSTLVTHVAQLMQWETQLVASAAQSNATHPLQSPLLLCSVFRFYKEYCLRFVDPDTELYNDLLVNQAGPLFQALNGGDVNPVLELLLSCVHQIIRCMPLESDLVSAAAQALIALSTCRNDARLRLLVGSEHVHQMALYITSAPTSGASHGGTAGCRLNGSGLLAMFEALGQLFVRAEHAVYFTQLCGAVFGWTEGKTELHNRNLFQRVLSSLCGLARCSAGQDQTLYALFDASWPVLRASIRLYVDADDILKQYLTLLTLYAEHQLSRLPSTSCIALYQTSYEVFSIYHKRFGISEHRADSADEEAVLFRNESCMHILELLNHLSAKDFAFTEDCAEAVNQTFEQEISAVLLHGLELILPILSEENLRTFPTTAEKYYAFMAFVTSSYVVEMARWLNGKPGGEGAKILQEVVLRLHCGASAVVAPAARSALQALQSIAVHQWKCRANQMPHQSNVPFQAAEVLAQVIDSLLQAILTSSSSAHGNDPSSATSTSSSLVSWDRVDSLSNTLVTFIALDNARFSASAQYLVSLQPAAKQATLMQCLTRLTTARGVNLQAIDKPNRQKFLLNFREFITQLKSLSMS